MESNLVAFDAYGATVLPMADVIRSTTPAHQQAIVRHIVDRVIVENGMVPDIRVRLEARPFFAELVDGVALAPPDGLEPPTQALGRPRSIH